MKISEEKVDALNSILAVEIEKKDYQQKVDQRLRELCRKTVLPGFRPGKVPLGLIKKRFGAAILAEELNELVSRGASDYIHDNSLRIIGEPLPRREEMPTDFETQESFEFKFDLGIVPEIQLNIREYNDKIPFYRIIASDSMIEERRKELVSQFGSFVEIEDESTEKDILIGTLTELDEAGIPSENGLHVENAELMPISVNEAERQAFIGLQKGATIVVNPQKMYGDNTALMAFFLHTNKEKAQNISASFIFDITSVTRHKDAEVDEAFFITLFGEGSKIKTDEDFREWIKLDIDRTFSKDVSMKFIFEIKKHLLQKYPVALPDEFTKRWLHVSKELPEDEIEKTYPSFQQTMQWNFLARQLSDELGIEVTQKKIEKVAKEFVLRQTSRQGIQVTDDLMQKYVTDLLAEDKYVQIFAEEIINDGIGYYFINNKLVEYKEISLEDFLKMKNNNEEN
ncbi:MAG: hypothetical protein LBD45_01065 [Bacteroidales bacterium]|jgi:trigger factor|nr:hypothetical protein [Bacteroidales bacterium]